MIFLYQTDVKKRKTNVSNCLILNAYNLKLYWKLINCKFYNFLTSLSWPLIFNYSLNNICTFTIKIAFNIHNFNFIYFLFEDIMILNL